MEDAINQLQDLGVTRGQAKKALARYNNDVARAADFIFSGNPISDDEAEETPTESDEALALRLNAEEEAAAAKVYVESNPFKETITETVIDEQPEPAKKIQPLADDSDSWSVVPFQSPSYTRPVTPEAIISKESSLTWWKDPEDPNDRIALDDVPIGLRPPSYNFAYSPILIQALFHVSAFRYAVLSFRPIPYSWGTPANYWKGFGEPVPGYIMRDVVTKREIVTRRPSSAPVVLNSSSKEEDLISFEDSSKENTDEGDKSTDINESIVEADLPPRIVETPIDETVEFVEFVDNELQLMPKCVQTLAEMQKIFAFLSNSKRLYGSVSHYVRALNTKLATNNWEFSDKTFDAFLDMMIKSLVQADEHADNAAEASYIPIFRSLFLIKAIIEDGNDFDEEEVHYLTLNVDKNMCSFHDCLDPLVFESYQAENQVDEEADPSISSDGEDEPSFKFTTFKQIPPILMVAFDNRSYHKKTGVKYIVEKNIYMDRYMIEKRDQALEGFKQMDLCRQEIKNAKAEIERLKASNALGMDKRDVLRRTLDYFEQKEQEEGDEEGLESLKYVLNSVKDKIDARLADLENIILDQADKMHQVFDKDDMKENGYELRASFHHDGKDGTGHYWAYIWVEPMEPNLLQDIPSEGGWFRFCDAYVIASSETELYNDPYPPFALMYANETIPKYTRDQLSECIPESLKGFISADNDFLYQEIQAKEHTNDQGTASLISTSDDDVEFAEKQDSANCLDLESSSATFDDNISVGTAVGHTTNEYSEPQQYSFTGQGFSKLKERVNSKIMQVVDFDSDDYRLLMSFENFLARTQNQLLLEHLYLLYSSDEKNQLVDEEASKTDDELKIIWHEYETFINIAGMVTQALSYFANQDFSSALQSLLDAKRHEASWKDGLLLDLDVSSAFSGLTTISFNNIVEKYGKECLKILNKAAYKKASNESYRTRGLEDAIRIAYQAQTIIGPDNIQTDQIYQSLGELWLTFTEQQSVGSSLTDTQVELLNTLVMTYLEGQGGGSIGIPSRGESPVDNSVDDEKDNDLPLWQKYQQVCSQSEHVLTTLSNKQ